ncbi:MAG: dicarboxylate/amino acid:cation symporter [Myxococcales bacterium]|nr:dicarboxylate/amino acid:cation symporter [Myxococcales bacterium]
MEGTARKLELHWQILIALVLAIVLGKLGNADSAIFGLQLKSVADFVGELFLRALRMLVVPLIMASIISAVAGLGETHSLGRLGLKTAAYYVTTSLIAILIGLVVVDLIQPGIVNGVAAKDQIGLSGDVVSVQKAVEGRSGKDVVDVFLRLVPKNVVEDAAKGEMLGLIFFSLLFGFFTTRIDDEKRRVVRAFWDGVYDIMLKITDWVIGFAPIGVFALVFKVVLTTGFDAFRPLLVFFFCVLLALGIHLLVALPLLMRLVGGLNPLKHYKAMAPALLMAFSTASSSATLPLTMDCVRDRAGVSPRVSSFTLPLGATVNMDGTALYECVAAIFIAQAYGIQLSLTQQFTVVLIALLTSIGVAGIPAASLVAITLILTSIGLPVEAIGLILAVDRVLDMCRTAVNVFSDSCGAVLIAKSEGEVVLSEPAEA